MEFSGSSFKMHGGEMKLAKEKNHVEGEQELQCGRNPERRCKRIISHAAKKDEYWK